MAMRKWLCWSLGGCLHGRWSTIQSWWKQRRQSGAVRGAGMSLRSILCRRRPSMPGSGLGRSGCVEQKRHTNNTLVLVRDAPPKFAHIVHVTPTCGCASIIGRSIMERCCWRNNLGGLNNSFNFYVISLVSTYYNWLNHLSNHRSFIHRWIDLDEL